MRRNDVLQMPDTRHLSPQTTSSSGYHSDLSSPQSIHENPIDQIEKKPNKNSSRLSSFLRKQYERAKTKFLSTKRPVTTTSKATSTTPVSCLPDTRQTVTINHKRSSFIEPVKSIYVHPLQTNKSLKIPSHRSSSYSNPINSPSYRRLVTLSNYENRSSNYHIKPRISQDYYPYKYLHKNYGYTRSIYAPLSDFISTTTTSAFKPIQSSKAFRNGFIEDNSFSDDPCDLEVAQYFHQSYQWSNPNYYDIYQKNLSMNSYKKNYTETLC